MKDKTSSNSADLREYTFLALAMLIIRLDTLIKQTSRKNENRKHLLTFKMRLQEIQNDFLEGDESLLPCSELNKFEKMLNKKLLPEAITNLIKKIKDNYTVQAPDPDEDEEAGESIEDKQSKDDASEEESSKEANVSSNTLFITDASNTVTADVLTLNWQILKHQIDTLKDTLNNKVFQDPTLFDIYEPYSTALENLDINSITGEITLDPHRELLREISENSRFDKDIQNAAGEIIALYKQIKQQVVITSTNNSSADSISSTTTTTTTITTTSEPTQVSENSMSGASKEEHKHKKCKLNTEEVLEDTFERDDKVPLAQLLATQQGKGLYKASSMQKQPKQAKEAEAEAIQPLLYPKN